jgi:hypothetical protein
VPGSETRICARCGHQTGGCPRCGRDDELLGGGRSTPGGGTEEFCHVNTDDELRRANGGTCYELSTRYTFDEAIERYLALRFGHERTEGKTTDENR